MTNSKRGFRTYRARRLGARERRRAANYRFLDIISGHPGQGGEGEREEINGNFRVTNPSHGKRLKNFSHNLSHSELKKGSEDRTNVQINQLVGDGAPIIMTSTFGRKHNPRLQLKPAKNRRLTFSFSIC